MVKSYLLLPVDVKGGGFLEELLLRMPLLDLPPPPLTLESKPRKKTEQSGEEVLIYACARVYLLRKYLLLRRHVVTLSLSEAFSLKKRIEETKKQFRVLNPISCGDLNLLKGRARFRSLPLLCR